MATLRLGMGLGMGMGFGLGMAAAQTFPPLGGMAPPEAPQTGILRPALPSASASSPGSAAVQPQSVVQIFMDGCVMNEGVANEVVDWALAKGFEALDPSQIGAEDLLRGVPGTVLALPGSGGRVLLAAGVDRRCLVWAEQTHGPRVRIAFQKMLSSLGAKGGRVKPEIDRNVNSAGAWRNQLQWRYRRVGGYQDYGLGAATTLAGGLGVQLLHFAPVVPRAPTDPDGLPRR